MGTSMLPFPDALLGSYDRVSLSTLRDLSYLLSQGVLQADIAILYPVSTAQAKMNEEKAASTAFKSGTRSFQ